jgi:TetR/AcrR family transcriptional repressor of nem operon
MAGRPKQFDVDEALDKAVTLFWNQGYGATSVQDLVDHLGINRGSLYDTFGDKRQLFLLAFERYLNQIADEALKALSGGGSALAAIRKYFDTLLKAGIAYSAQPGCLAVNSAVELALHDREILSRVKAYFLKTEDAFCALVERAQAAGELSPTHNARAVARYLVNFSVGLTVLVKTKPSNETLHDVFEVGLSLLKR